MDPIAQMKEQAKQMWSGFTALEMMTGTAAPRLVRHAGVRPGQKVLDIACGTGVVALTAARLGAQVTGLDLTPELVARAKQNAATMELEASFIEGDVEQLPFGDAQFDVVLSQFGHMFAPRPEVAIREMLRVLRPGGTIAFSTWPPELYVGGLFAIIGRYAPPPPPGTSPPGQWGEPATVRERLGDAVRDVVFDRDVMRIQILSPRHLRIFSEQGIGPMQKLAQMLEAQDPGKLVAMRAEIEAHIARYFEDNQVRQDYLMSRAIKK